ncbi:hypothetical protein [uncultured Mediterranean phage uvMED]|nr:hypothetical protein [uncultured Mediterranean phage uvMED]
MDEYKKNYEFDEDGKIKALIEKSEKTRIEFHRMLCKLESERVKKIFLDHERKVKARREKEQIQRENQNTHIPGMANKHIVQVDNLDHFVNGVTFGELMRQFDNKGDI